MRVTFVTALVFSVVGVFSSLATAEPVPLAEFGRTVSSYLRSLPGDYFAWSLVGPGSGLHVTTLSVEFFESDPPVWTEVPVGTVISKDITGEPWTTIGGVGENTIGFYGESTSGCCLPDAFSNYFPVDTLWPGPPQPEYGSNYGWFGSALVPQLGPGFTGYDLTRIDLEILENFGSFASFTAKVTLFGEPSAIPEPSCGYFTLVLISWYLSPRKRGQN